MQLNVDHLQMSSIATEDVPTRKKVSRSRSKDPSSGSGDTLKKTIRRSKSNADVLDKLKTTSTKKKAMIPRVKSFDESTAMFAKTPRSTIKKRRNRSSTPSKSAARKKHLKVSFSKDSNIVHMLPEQTGGAEKADLWYSKQDLNALLDHEQRLSQRRKGRETDHSSSRGLERTDKECMKIGTYVRVMLREQKMLRESHHHMCYTKELRMFSLALTKEDRKKAVQLGYEDASIQRKQEKKLILLQAAASSSTADLKIESLRASTGTTGDATVTSAPKFAATNRDERPTNLLRRVGSMSKLLVSVLPRDVASKCA